MKNQEENKMPEWKEKFCEEMLRRIFGMCWKEYFIYTPSEELYRTIMELMGGLPARSRHAILGAALCRLDNQLLSLQLGISEEKVRESIALGTRMLRHPTRTHRIKLYLAPRDDSEQ